MRICYLANASSIHTRRWVRYFASKGHEVHLISGEPCERREIENVNLHVLKGIPLVVPIVSYLADLSIKVAEVRMLVKRLRPDILHAHYVTDNGWLGFLSGFRPFVVTVWGTDVLIAPNRSRRLKWMVKLALKKADVITTDGEHVKGPLLRLGAHRQKIRLIYFGVDTEKFSPGEKDRDLVRELDAVGLPIVFSLRALEAVYDIETLIAAVPLVLKETPGVRFVAAGKGSLKGKLVELAKTLGVSDNIRFIGQIPDDRLPQYLRSADIYVSTSLSDAGLSSSTAEAMSCGLPVVITDFGDNGKWVQDGVNGYIIPLKSPQILASRIVQLVRNKDMRCKFGQISRQIIEEKNNWEKEMGKVEKLYQELIERHRK